MQTIFNRIYTQFARLSDKYQSDVDLSFNKGASDEDFEKLENVLGIKLPDEFKEVYRIHNGSDIEGNFIDIIWFSIDGIINDYQVWKEVFDEGHFLDEAGNDIGCEPQSNAIKADFHFNPKWIPISANGGGDGLMIDLDPTPDGRVRQIIQMWHDEPSRTLEAVSLKALFEQFATDLENDRYVIHPDYEGIVPIDILSNDELAQIGISYWTDKIITINIYCPYRQSHLCVIGVGFLSC